MKYILIFLADYDRYVLLPPMLKRQTRILLRKAVVAGLWFCAVYVALSALGLGSSAINLQVVEYFSLAYLLGGLFSLWINDRRLVLICFGCSALLAFIVHEKLGIGSEQWQQKIEIQVPNGRDSTNRSLD